MTTRIALAQLQIAFGDPDTNLLRADEMINAAADQNADWILFPELWHTGFDLLRLQELSASFQEVFSYLQKRSAEKSIFISGSYAVPGQKGLTNRFITVSPDQTILPVYDKIHLFGLMKEDRHFLPGQEPVRQPLPFGEVGLSICYDLRFPELFRQYSRQGAPILANCAEWPAARTDHWLTLTAARAIENLAWFIAVNAVGKSGKEVFAGCSRVISPWGETIAQAGSRDPELLFADLDLGLISEIRAAYPFLKDQRL